MVKCRIKFRTQKNGQNGAEKLFTYNYSGKCFPSAMLRIIRRFISLQGANNTKKPMAVYQSGTYDKSTKFVTAPDIEVAMRRVAARVYKLDHSMGMSTTQLKFLLRWRSDAFILYLRKNTAILYPTTKTKDRTMLVRCLIHFKWFFTFLLSTL
jgi:hypothetical protein